MCNHPADVKKKLRIELFADEIESIMWVDKINNDVIASVEQEVIFPAKNFVTTAEKKQLALATIKADKRLQNMALVKISRLSVSPVKKEEYDIIVGMGS